MTAWVMGDRALISVVASSPSMPGIRSSSSTPSQLVDVAIVVDLQSDATVPLLEPDPGVLGVGMLDDVAHGLLGHPIQEDLLGGRKALGQIGLERERKVRARFHLGKVVVERCF